MHGPLVDVSVEETTQGTCVKKVSFFRCEFYLMRY